MTTCACGRYTYAPGAGVPIEHQRDSCVEGSQIWFTPGKEFLRSREDVSPVPGYAKELVEAWREYLRVHMDLSEREKAAFLTAMEQATHPAYQVTPSP